MEAEHTNTGDRPARPDTPPITSGLQSCRYCSAYGNGSDRYCTGCGMPFDNRCAKCGAEIRNGEAVYCAGCGDRVRRFATTE